VKDYAPFPLTPALSLGERENLLPRWVEICARESFQRGVSTSRFRRENLRPRWAKNDAPESFQDGNSAPLSPRERDRVRGKGTSIPPRWQNTDAASPLGNQATSLMAIAPSPLDLEQQKTQSPLQGTADNNPAWAEAPAPARRAKSSRVWTPFPGASANSKTARPLHPGPQAGGPAPDQPGAAQGIRAASHRVQHSAGLQSRKNPGHGSQNGVVGGICNRRTDYPATNSTSTAPPRYHSSATSGESDEGLSSPENIDAALYFQVPFPLTPALSLGERENLLPSWAEICARDIFQRGDSSPRLLRENLRPRWVETDARENSQGEKSDPLSPREWDRVRGKEMLIRHRRPDVFSGPRGASGTLRLGQPPPHHSSRQPPPIPFPCLF
jgi:hypothetical protein